MQGLLHHKLDLIMFLDQVTVSWFVQNQTKRHATSARVTHNPQIGLIGLHRFQSLFDVGNCIR